MSDPNQSAGPRPAVPPLARLAIEAGPLVVFFVANAAFRREGHGGIFIATGAFMAAMVVALAASWRLERRLPPMPLVTTVFVLVFGGLTLWLANDLFIKIKPTILDLCFAAILAVGLALRRPFLQLVLGTAFQLTDEGWRRLTVRWIAFFCLLAALNELVWRTTSTDTWVAFKLFGVLPLTLVFSATLLPLIQRHQLEPETETEPAPESGSE